MRRVSLPLFETDEALPFETVDADAVRETAAALPYVRVDQLPDA